MKKWFTSLNGAVTLSIIALLTEVWRGFLDAMFVLPVDFGDEGLMNIAAVIYTLLFAGWAWLLVLTRQGSRTGLVVAFGLNLLVLFAVPGSWLIIYCPVACRAEAGIIFNLANTLNLIFGSLAVIALGIQIWAGRAEKMMRPAKTGV